MLAGAMGLASIIWTAMSRPIVARLADLTRWSRIARAF
jgi:hypothetical protein